RPRDEVDPEAGSACSLSHWERGGVRGCDRAIDRGPLTRPSPQRGEGARRVCSSFPLITCRVGKGASHPRFLKSAVNSSGDAPCPRGNDRWTKSAGFLNPSAARDAILPTLHRGEEAFRGRALVLVDR